LGLAPAGPKIVIGSLQQDPIALGPAKPLELGPAPAGPKIVMVFFLFHTGMTVWLDPAAIPN